MVADVVNLSEQEFDEAVADALDDVPAELLDLMNNVVFLVEDEPPRDGPELLGVYDGTPLTERNGGWAAGALPDRITIFRGPTLRLCATRAHKRSVGPRKMVIRSGSAPAAQPPLRSVSGVPS